MCLQKDQDSQEFNQNGLGQHGFGGHRRKICVSSSGRSGMSFRVLENALVWTPRERRNSDWDGACWCLGCVRNKGHVSHDPMCVNATFLHDNQVPQTQYHCFVPSSTGVFEKAGPTRFPCVFVAVLRCAHTLACIIRGLTSTCSFTSYVRSSGPPCSVQP